jgi:anthranilate phosphoribosyltransferase
MSETPLFLALRRLAAADSLSALETQAALAELLDGKAPEAAAGAFLTALRQKGETAQELLGAVAAIRERMITFEIDRACSDYLDTCGTGGDGADTVNVSTAAAIVVAACGARVVKHGNRSASGRSGSSDVLEQLGIGYDVELAILTRCLDELGITFLFAPRFQPGLGRLARARSQLPFRTIFNLVGPLCNPASPTHQLVGVPHEDHARRMAEVLAQTPCLRRALVVSGSDGLDEVTLAGSTRLQIVEAGQVSEEVWTRDDFGLQAVNAAELRVSGPEESARLMRRLFEGEPGPVREIVLANAAAALWTISPCPLPQAVHRAATAIDSGAARALLQRWSELTRGLP